MIDRRRGAPAALALAALAVFLLQGCDRVRPGTTEAHNTVRAYLSADPSSMSLIGKTDANAEELAVQITDSLVQYDSELRLRPRLAESWEFSPDRLTLTFKLRDGVRWHDGRPLTAQDVVFTVNKLLEPEQENRVWAPLFKELESVEAADARTVVARYSLATPDVIEGWRVPILPLHVAGGDEDLYNGRFADHPIGCGPFRFVRHRPRVARSCSRPTTTTGTGGPGSIGWSTRSTRISAPPSRHCSPARSRSHAGLVQPLEGGARNPTGPDTSNGSLYYRSSVWTMFWNQDGSNPFFVDPRVRQAMVLALDRERFVENVLDGLGRPGATTYHPDPTWADPDIEPRSVRPDRGRTAARRGRLGRQRRGRGPRARRDGRSSSG